MNPKQRTILEDQLFSAACVGFKRMPTVDFRADVALHVRDGVLYVILKNETAVGFAVMKDFPEVNGTYISGVVKGEGTPSGIVERIVAQHVKKFGVVAVRTQNDRVVEIMKNVCCEVVPVDREAGVGEMEVLRHMGLVSDKVRENMIVMGHYGDAPMIGVGERRRSNNELVRKATDRLNYQQGDALLLMGYVR